MSVMFGNGTTEDLATGSKIHKILSVKGKTIPTTWKDANGKDHTIPTTKKVYNEVGEEIPEGEIATKLTDSSVSYVTFDIDVTGTQITVGPDSFPGTYYVTGSTYQRSEITGEDEYFQFILPKAKVTSENTITMEAEGDPSVFNLNLEVLRATLTDEDGNSEKVMMKLVKYDVDTQ